MCKTDIHLEYLGWTEARQYRLSKHLPRYQQVLKVFVGALLPRLSTDVPRSLTEDLERLMDERAHGYINYLRAIKPIYFVMLMRKTLLVCFAPYRKWIRLYVINIK